MALSYTYRCIVDLCKYLLTTTGFQYVLIGKFTTDHLEKQFGKLRQGSGGTYFITVQGILEKVGIMKTKLLLQLGTDVNDFNVELGHSCAKCSFLLTEEMCEVFHNLTQLEETLMLILKWP